MKAAAAIAAALLVCGSIGSIGCNHAPGKPGSQAETQRPDQTLSTVTLYESDCSGCHGDGGVNGAALPLDNPVYLAWAGRERLIQIVSNGVPQTAMPGFGTSGGGLLTDEQVDQIVDGMIAQWGKPGILNDANPPAFAPTSKGDAAQGKAAYESYCARCHGADGKGASKGDAAIGSIVDPTYLSLVSGQGLRDIIVSGWPGGGMPDWRGDVPGKPMTDQNVTDIVAWLVSQRS
jgi:mono/diheme cytochrome c family protein